MVPEINLLPQRDRKAASKKIFFSVVGIIFALLLVALTVQFFVVTKSVDRLTAEKQTVELQKTTVETEVASLQLPEVADLATSVRFVESVTYPVSPLLAEIHKYLGENTYLRSVEFAENAIEFEVDFETMVDVATYVGDLTGSTYFADVKVESIDTFNPRDEDEEEKTTAFDEVERFSNTITVIIEPDYLLTGGGVR